MSRKPWSHVRRAAAVALTAAALAGAPCMARADTFVPLEAKATYLHTYGESPLPPAAMAVDLASLGYAPGDRLHLAVLGDIDNGPGSDTFSFTLGLFSASNTLLGNALVDRVPGALASDAPAFVTLPTYFGNQATDIPQDFGFDRPEGIDVTIPAGALFLFLAKNDQLYNDNSDPDHDYGVLIGLAPVPEAPSWAMWLAGAAVLGRLRRRLRA
jgi:hypothetical protein